MSETILFIVGIFGLIGGNLTVSKAVPIRGRRARITGSILMLALPLWLGVILLEGEGSLAFLQGMSVGELFWRWVDLLPVSLVLVGAFLYLYTTSPDKKSENLSLWIAASLPALGLVIARNLPILYLSILDFSKGLPWTLNLDLLPYIIIGIVLPIAMALVANLIMPVCTKITNAFLFALPLLIVHIYFFSVLDLILPGMAAMANPGDIPTAGQQEVRYGMESILVSLLVMLLAAAAGWIATRIRRKA